MSDKHQSITSLRMAELLASLSLAIDLVVGQPMEWVLRSCLLATRLSESLGLSERDCQDAYYLALLRHVGCTSTSTTDAVLMGEGFGLAKSITIDMDDMAQMMELLLRNIAKDKPLFERARAVDQFMAAGPAYWNANHTAHCEVASRLAESLSLSNGIQRGLWHVYERWDGK